MIDIQPNGGEQQTNTKSRAIWKSWHLYHLHCRRHRHRHCNFFLSSETLFFDFWSFLWSKTSMVKSLSNTLASFSGSVYCCLEQLLCRDIVSACLWRKELHNGCYLRVFKTRKAESCILYLCVFLVRNHIRDHFLEVFCFEHL